MRSPAGGGSRAMSPRRRRALARLGILLLFAGLIWSTQPNKRLGARRQRAQRASDLDPALKVGPVALSLAPELELRVVALSPSLPLPLSAAGGAPTL